jgi:cobalt-zinc-cadmium efflux system protein
MGLLREALHVLMEGVPRSIEIGEVGRRLARIEGVLNVHDLHIWNISSGRMALSAHVELTDLHSWPRILDESREVLSERYGIDHVTLQPEMNGPASASEKRVIKVVRR